MEPLTEDEAHPPAHALDAIAAGDQNERVSSHVASCPACTRYVTILREQAVRFRGGQDARSFVTRARGARGQSIRVVRWSRAAWVAGPVLAAAALLLVLRARSLDGDLMPGMPRAPSSSVGPQSRFKGGPVVAVVRERAGQQEHLVGPFQVHAGDRIRVEVSTDQEGPFAAGLLTDEGQWVPLLAPAVLEAGTHYSELAARFDDSPTRATLLVGKPDDVDRARRTRDFGGVLAWRVTTESGP